MNRISESGFSKVLMDDLENGNIFLWEGEYYMKVDAEENDTFTSVSLETGELVNIPYETMVLSVNKVTIEGE